MSGRLLADDFEDFDDSQDQKIKARLNNALVEELMEGVSARCFGLGSFDDVFMSSAAVRGPRLCSSTNMARCRRARPSRRTPRSNVAPRLKRSSMDMRLSRRPRRAARPHRLVSLSTLCVHRRASLRPLTVWYIDDH